MHRPIISRISCLLPPAGATLPSPYPHPQVAGVCESLLPSVKAVNASLYDLWLVLEEAAQLSSCENLNGPYQAAVYYELCAELPKGLLGFWVSCVILTLLLVVLVCFSFVYVMRIFYHSFPIMLYLCTAVVYLVHCVNIVFVSSSWCVRVCSFAFFVSLLLFLYRLLCNIALVL